MKSLYHWSRFFVRQSIRLGMALGLMQALTAGAANQDHPLLSGMPGYEVDSRSVSDFGKLDDQRVFKCAPSRNCNATDPGFDAEGKFVAQGKVTTLRYANRSNGETLAVWRNYEAAIKSGGGRALTYTSGYEGQKIFLFEQGGRRTWVMLESFYKPSYKLIFVEEKAMQQVVTAGQLADAINKQGFATLYVNFDTNSAVVKPDAKPAIDEIAALLAKDKTLRLSVEGHTDNVGTAAANKTLSAARAASMVKALVQTGVDANRLASKGYGSETPVADNRSEDGRAKNRRVELVKLK